MKNFSQFLFESSDKVSSDTAGKLHELLTGYHLNGGKHMEKHSDKNSESPKQVHDKLKSTITKNQYDHINKKAKSAANDIRTKIETNGHKIHSVHWTSKEGDITRTTGIVSTQKEDASDIIATTSDKKHKIHHGISLKVSDSKTKHIPVSNPGISSTLGGEHILETHRQHLKRKYPKINSLPANRREHMKNDHKMQSYIRKRNLECLHAITKHTVDKLNEMRPQHLVNHIRKHILAANKTPLQQHGHTHMRHTTYMHGDEIKHHSYDPSESHEHILRDPKNISIKHDSEQGSARIRFEYKGKPFAAQRFKFESQSDPLSNIKGSSNIIGND